MQENRTDDNAQAESASPRRRHRRWPWIVLALAIATIAGTRAALPWLVEHGAAYGSRVYLGLPIRIDNADFSLMAGEVVLEGVSVAAGPDDVSPRDAALQPPPIDPAAALLHWDRVSLQLSWRDLRERTLHLKRLVLESPSVRVQREGDGRIDPLRHARPLVPASGAQDEAQAADEEASPPWRVVVDDFELSAPEVVVGDPPTGQNLLEFSLDRFALTDVAVQGSDLSLGGIGIEGPVLRVRRDLVLAEKPQTQQASAAAGAVEAAPAPADATGQDVPPAGAAAAKPAADGDAAKPAADGDAAKPAADGDAAKPAADGDAAPQPPAASVDHPVDAAPPERGEDPARDAQSAGAAGHAAKAKEKAGYRIAKIDIADARFTWITDHGPVDVALGLKASDVTMDEGKRFPIDLQLRIGQGDIAVAGEVGILPPAYHGTFRWSGLPFPPLLLAALPQFTPWLRSADSSGDLTVDFDLGRELHLAGRTSVQSLAIADPDGEKAALGWSRLEVVARQVSVPMSEQGKPSGTTRVVLDLVKLVEPKIRYTRPTPVLDALFGLVPPDQAKVVETSTGKTETGQASAGKTKAVQAHAGKEQPAAASAGKEQAAAANAGKEQAAAASAATPKTAPQPKSAAAVASSASGSPDGAAAAAPVPPLDLSIALLELAAGEFELVDNQVTPPVRSHMRELTLTASNVHFPDPSAAAIRVHALLPTNATLAIEGDLRPGNNGDFTVTVQKLDLPVFSPYASGAGATLDAGQASVKTKVRLRGAVTELDNDLLLRKFGVSLHDPGSFERSFGVPIDLALALLRDPAGNIELRIPVRVDEQGATVSVGAVIASALRQALIGAVTAPLKMLGAVFGGADAESKGFALDPVPSTPGIAEVAAGQQGRIDGLATLLGQRPQIGLLLRGRTGPEDRPLVAEQILVETQQADKALPEVKEAGFLARRRIVQALARKAKGKALELSAEDQALYERYVAAVKIPDERMRALATARAQRVRALLLEKKVAGNRLTVGEPEAEGAPAVVVSLKTK